MKRASEHFRTPGARPDALGVGRATGGGASVSPGSSRIRVGPTAPEMWILGSSDYGAQLAAHFGLPYAFAYFFSDGKGFEDALAPVSRELFARAPAILVRWQPFASGHLPRIRTTKRGACSSRANTGASDSKRAFACRWFHRKKQPGIVLCAGRTCERIDALRRKAFVGTGEHVAQRLRGEALAIRARRTGHRHMDVRRGGAAALL